MDTFINRIEKHKTKIAAGVVALILLLLAFQAGVMVGYHKAFFSYSGGDRFYRMMEGGRALPNGAPPFQAFFSDDLLPSHGVSGKVVSLTLPSFVVAAPNNLEKTVIVNGETVIRRFRETVPQSDIRADDYAIVLGDPDSSGNIQAKFIRLAPMPIPAMPSVPSR